MLNVFGRRLACLGRQRFGLGRWQTQRGFCDKRNEEKSVMNQLASLADADPNAFVNLGRRLSSRTLEKLGRIAQEETNALKNVKVATPTRRQLMLVTLGPMPLFVVFGVIDNAVMIVAGEYFDITLGVAFGISTMAAAGLGNLVSDVLGLAVGGFVEDMFERFGITVNPGLTRAQETLSIVRKFRFVGNAVGVSIGCLIGLFPLYFYDFEKIAKMKRQSKIDNLFITVMEYVTDALEVENATLYVVDKEKNELWTKASYSKNSRGKLEDLTQVRIPLDKGVAGHCATSGDVINTSDADDLQRYGSRANVLTGQHNRNVLCIPIFGRTGDIIGVIQVNNKKQGNKFLVKDEVALTAMSSHISCALERAFFEGEETDDTNELLSALKASFEHQTHHLRFLTSRAEKTASNKGEGVKSAAEADDLDLIQQE